MRKEHAALLFITMLFLASITLGYSTIQYSRSGGSPDLKSGGSNTSKSGDPHVQSLLKAMLSSRSGDRNASPRRVKEETSSSEGLNLREDFPRSDFTFKPANIKTNCPVAVLPGDPMLVCTEGPANSLPVLPNSSPDDIIVWYNGTYYVPLVSEDGEVRTIRGISPGSVTIDTDTPLVFMTYNQSVTLEFRESSDNGVAHIHTSLPLKEESFRISGGYRIYRYSIGPVDPSQKPGYYPLFVTVKSGRGTAALLMWVALLKKPVVEITDYPAVVEGNGSLAITVAGTVRYPDGRPVESGVVWVTLNETKGKPGVQLGRGTVRHGRFIVNGTLEPGLPPGGYHVIAYYRGYEAYPSNSDPTIVVRREPQLSVEITNSTLRLYLHWRNVPLANETLNVSIGSGVVTLKTDGEGYATLNLSGVRADSTNIVYGGNRYYLPLNETVPLSTGEGGTSSTPILQKLLKLLKRSSRTFGGLFILLAAAALVSAGYSAYSKKKTGNRAYHPSGKESPGGSVDFLEPSRRVFLPDETVRVALSSEGELFLDGEYLGAGKEFTLRPGEGRHVLSAGKGELELYVLPPREAIIKAYELHFLPFVYSSGVSGRNVTPIEIERLLVRRGFDENSLRSVTRPFILAKYSEHTVGEKEFFDLIKGLRGLGVV